ELRGPRNATACRAIPAPLFGQAGVDARLRASLPQDGVPRERGRQARLSAEAAAWTSMGTVMGAGAPEIAQSGSLSPLPVTVQTIRWPGSTRPSACAWSRPATLAAEAS